jgi:molybdopterin molybdotransferase
MCRIPANGSAVAARTSPPAAEVLAAGTRLTAAHVGVAASVGAAQLKVFRRLRVALFSTGDELAMPGEPLKPGGIYNSNRYTLRALLEGLGCVVADLGIVPDTREATRAALRDAAAGNDLILTSGGVSVGEEDHVKPAVEAEGALDLWKIAIKPGKPLAFGRVGGNLGAGDTAGKGAAAFIGLPGNPVSSFVTFLMLVRPFILKSQGATELRPRARGLQADFDFKGDPRREFLRARINDTGGLDLFPNQSSGVLTSCTWADGLIDNPPRRAMRLRRHGALPAVFRAAIVNPWSRYFSLPACARRWARLRNRWPCRRASPRRARCATILPRAARRGARWLR